MIEQDGRASTRAAGWYDDPGGGGGRRYWDGTAWTEQAVAARRDPESLKTLLDPSDRVKFAKHCGRVVKELSDGEQVIQMASSVSGPPGLLALTDRRLFFVSKPDAITPMRARWWELAELAQTYTAAPDHLLVRVDTDNLLGFKSVRPPIAEAFAEGMWERGIERPKGLVPDEPSANLPAREPEQLVAALEAADQDAFSPFCERLAHVLAPAESVRLLAACVSNGVGLIALTDDRLLFVCPGLEDRIDVTPIPFSAVISAGADSPSFLRTVLNSSNVPQADFQQMRPALAEAFVRRFSDLGVGDPAAAAEAKAASAPSRTPLNVLPPKTLKLVKPHIAPDEDVFICLVGAFGQALIALSDRVLIAKAGWMSGNVFGGKVNTFPYREITGIEIHTAMATAVLIVQTPSFPGTQAGSYWSSGKTSPQELPNTIPLPNKRVLAQWQEYLALLRTAVTSGGLRRTTPSRPSATTPPVFLKPIAPKETSTDPAAPASGGGIAAEIERLAKLRESHIISEEEFTQAKAKLLG